MTHLTGRECKLEFAYRAQRFQVSAQAARFTKKAHGVKWRPCLGGGLVCIKLFLLPSKFTGQSVFRTVQSSCGVYRASCAPSCIEIKVRRVWHVFRNVTCFCVRFVCVSPVAESVLRVLLAATLVRNTAREKPSRLCYLVVGIDTGMDSKKKGSEV